MSLPVALVTGAGRGIGAATAHLLAERDHAIAVTDLDGERAAAVADAIVAGGGPAVGRALDVTSAADIVAALDEVTRRLGPIEVLVNNAGLLHPTRVVDIPEPEWDRVIGVNLKGTFLMAQAVLPGMIARGRGRIVNVSSTAGKSVSTVGGAHYTAAKAGVLGFTRHLASEVAASGITVNAVCPGLIDTEMVRTTIPPERVRQYADSFPIPRLGRPEEVAALIAFLVSEEASYVTGAAFDITGGDLMV